MLPTDQIINEATDEVDRAEVIHGEMPGGIIQAGAIVAEESGELVKAINDHVYHGGDLAACREEALHTAATALRFIEAIDALDTERGE